MRWGSPLKAGGEIPLHDPGLGVGSFSVFSDEAGRFEPAWHRSRHALHLFAIHFHDRHKHLVADDTVSIPPALTSRERECLSWLARGKTTWEIGRILEIADNTVRMHLNACAKKMGATSRLHAVVIALIHRRILP